MIENRLIIAGIGTEVGKTITSAIVCESLQADYWKPVQAGDLEYSDSKKVASLITNKKSRIHPEAYKLNTPMSPHAAAKIDRLTIDLENLLPPETDNKLIIELAGGLMVPLNDEYLNIDWIANSGFPVILVASYYLGSINHTLLSIELLKQKGIPIKGLIFSGDKNQSSFDIILKKSGIPCLLEVPHEPVLNPKIVRDHASRLHI